MVEMWVNNRVCRGVSPLYHSPLRLPTCSGQASATARQCCGIQAVKILSSWWAVTHPLCLVPPYVCSSPRRQADVSQIRRADIVEWQLQGFTVAVKISCPAAGQPTAADRDSGCQYWECRCCGSCGCREGRRRRGKEAGPSRQV